jgi:predicted  nucleic acid-binding Zn-ribbon protein
MGVSFFRYTHFFFAGEINMNQVQYLKDIYSINNELIEKEDKLADIRKEKTSLEEEIKKMLQDYKDKGEDIKKMKMARKNKEFELEAITKQINQLKDDQLMVKTNKDYSNLLMRLDKAKENKLRKEDEILELMEKIEDAEYILKKMESDSK